jgi:hypothetical protein
MNNKIRVSQRYKQRENSRERKRRDRWREGENDDSSYAIGVSDSLSLCVWSMRFEFGASNG